MVISYSYVSLPEGTPLASLCSFSLGNGQWMSTFWTVQSLQAGAVPGHHDVYLSAFSPGSSKAECAIWCPPQPMHLSDKLERTLSRIQMKHHEA